MHLESLKVAVNIRIATGPLAWYLRLAGFYGWAIFLEPQKEWTVSARLTRHSKSTGWRQRVAVAIRTALLDNIDPNGVHHG